MSGNPDDSREILLRLFSLESRRRPRRSTRRLIAALWTATAISLLGIGICLSLHRSAAVARTSQPGLGKTTPRSLEKPKSSALVQLDEPDVSHLRDQVLPSVVRVRDAGGEGTGFAVGPGLVATAYHVVSGRTVSVVLHNGECVKVVRVAAAHPGKDVAILQIDDSKSVRPLPLASKLPEPSEHVASFRLDCGHLTGKVTGSDTVLVCTTLKVYPGWSGSPVVNMQGEVVGMNVQDIVRRTSAILEGLPMEYLSGVRVGGKAVRGSAIAEVLSSLHAR
jgi:S1-C subfamily serine protease